MIPVIALHVVYLSKAFDPDEDLPLAITIPLVCEQVEIGYSLISATLPNLKAFIQAFNTEMMMDISHKLNRPNGTGTSGTSSESSQALPQPLQPERDIEEEEETLRSAPRTPSVTTRSGTRSKSSQTTPVRQSKVQDRIDSSHGFDFFGPHQGPQDHISPQDKAVALLDV